MDIARLAGRGTGVDGRVVEADVVAFYEEQQAQEEEAAPRVSPLAQRVAAEHGVSVESVQGTGHGGKVTQEDVKRASSLPAGPLVASSAAAACRQETEGQTRSSPCAGCGRWWPMPWRAAPRPRRMSR